MIIAEMVHALLAKMENRAQPREWKPIRSATPQKRMYSIDRQSHSQGESKIRRKLAAASNRINRKRVKHWRY